MVLTSSMSLHVLLHELSQLLTLSHCHSNRCVFSVDTPRGQVVSYLSVMVFCRFGGALWYRHLQKFPTYLETDKKSFLQSDSPWNKALLKNLILFTCQFNLIVLLGDTECRSSLNSVVYCCFNSRLQSDSPWNKALLKTLFWPPPPNNCFLRQLFFVTFVSREKIIPL